MKKILLSTVLSLCLFLCLVSCDRQQKPQDETTTAEQQTTTAETDAAKSVLETLQELSAKAYREVKLRIRTLTGGVELKASYTLTGDHVTYSVEQLSLFPTDGDLTQASPSFKTTLSGTATVKGGAVETVDGEAVTLPAYDELRGSFHFAEAHLQNVKSEAGQLSADVSSVSGFMGISRDLSDMKIVVVYSDSALQRLEMTYQMSNSAVTTVYEFTL